MAEAQDVTATSRFYVFGLAVLTVGSLAATTYAAFAGAVVAVAITLAGAVMFGWGVYRTCYRIEMSDGYLILRYLYRRRVVRLEQVRRIEFIESDEDTPAKFAVSLDDGTQFRVTANGSTRQLLRSMVERQPGILTIGNI